MGVEQVRGAVQRDRGLAGAGAALHDEHAAGVGADDLVLLGLDGLDDVAHPAGPRGGHRGEQRGLADEPLLLGADRVPVEDLVVEGDHAAAAQGDVAAPPYPLGGGGGGDVEGAGGRGAPVEQQRLVVPVGGAGVVGDADAPDVAAAAVAHVEAPEAQAVLGGVELGHPRGVPGEHRLAFHAGLLGLPVLAEHRGEPPFGLVPQLVDAPVEPLHVPLLARDLGVDQLPTLPVE